MGETGAFLSSDYILGYPIRHDAASSAKTARRKTRLIPRLGVLVQDYDRRHPFPADASTAAERLQHLLEQSGKTAADLLPTFGQRSHVNEALRGKRPISAPQAKKLGALFHLNPVYFLDLQ